MKKNNLCLVSCEAFGRAARCQEGFAERSEAGGVDAGGGAGCAAEAGLGVHGGRVIFHIWKECLVKFVGDLFLCE